MTHDKFERSSEKDKFEDFESDEAMVVWLDLLGTVGLSRAGLKARIDDLVAKIKEISATGPIFDDGTFVGTPNSALQYSVVGDAVLLAQKNRPQTDRAAQHGLLLRTLALSKYLFDTGVPHRGVVAIGHVYCLGDENAKIISGQAVIDAIKSERLIQSIGLFCHPSSAPFFKWNLGFGGKRKIRAISKKELGRVVSPLLYGVAGAFFGEDQLPSWKKFAEEFNPPTDKMGVLGHIKTSAKVWSTRRVVRRIDGLLKVSES